VSVAVSRARAAGSLPCGVPGHRAAPRSSDKLTLKASRISSSESVSFILRAIMVRNSGKSMVPFPSASTCRQGHHPRTTRSLFAAGVMHARPKRLSPR
jgi:hypothetical protein